MMAFWCAVLHAFTRLDEQFKALGDLEFLLIAIFRNGRSGNVLHHEERLPLLRCPGVKNLGNGGDDP